ncbi:MAG: YadA-like family protein, partial [Haemophilus parainfluenzae]|nr:YadA-like family protein [Haemophilus parainfluenzae]
GPKGKDGKDGASINITTDNGKQTLVNKEVGADGKKDQAQRIIYVPTDKDGNPLKDEKGNTIKREVATMDDGLTFVGNEGSHDAALGTEVKVKGATDNKDWSKFDAGKNIMTKVEGDTITVGLANDLDVNNVKVANNVTAGNVTATGTISAPTIKAGDTTITNGKVANLKHHIENPTTVVDDKVLNVSEDVKKEAATVRDVLNSGWNLQANGNAVDAVTHGNTVNFVNGKGITVTAEPNEDGTTSKVSFDVNVDNDTITVNDKGQLVSNGSTNFNVATKDGGNKVAKKGGSSTAKITSGKTITYTAGKNIAIEQNGGDILVSTTDDVNHNSVTTKDLTVNKGGNVDMGGNQVHNVKAGTKDTDAVNVSQLKQSVGDVHKRINKVGKEARGGIAGANAAAGLPQVYIPGKSMVAASAGTFKGESAVAVGYSRSSDNGKVIFKLQGNANTQGDVGGSVGVGYQW